MTIARIHDVKDSKSIYSTNTFETLVPILEALQISHTVEVNKSKNFTNSRDNHQ